ncbi:type IV secretory system conjugative DNA transfer family protein [Paracoccus aeridis]|uniref:type IV secretory system conjugative DNA transfer family protein n=1 Tax=Paracoccus aeridis TaxID=1966466 RepID=UPI0010AA5946|nr:type IV secretory system conjugative DNA transfer family protein [Paracoccus aeridis]
MPKVRMLGGVAFFALIGLAFAYVLATGYVTARMTGQAVQIDWSFLAENWRSLRASAPRDWTIVQIIFAGCVLGMMLLASLVIHEGLTRFGQTHWQTRRELKRNGFFAKPGRGFVLAKDGKPGSRRDFICSARFPHCLVIAPTGRGKGTGFVIPNLLTFAGSAVVLDVKGENYDKTARHRASLGDKVWRFAPVDWDRPTHRYNPLERIAVLPNPDQRQMELKKTADLFLQSDNDNMKGLLEGGIDLFVAAGIYAMERGKPTLGEIYRLVSAGGDKNKQYLAYADEVKSRAAQLIFERLASINDRTLTSYLSLLMTSGLSAWANPAIDRATSVSDFDFRTFRQEPQTVYLVVPPDDIRSLAPLIRLFFADLIASLQAKEPGSNEPWPVMILLDEFDRLGKMPIVAESIKTLRSYGGNLALVTQTIPALDEIYGENTRLSLQGGAGVKVYMTPSEERTVKELSEAVGKTTKRVVSKSRTLGKGPLSGMNVSERTEEVPLLNEDNARRLDLDDIILVIDGQHPARAKRIKYYEDRTLKPVFEKQAGTFPMPDPRERAAEDFLRETERRADSLQQRLDEMETRVTTAVQYPDSEPAIRRRASRALQGPIELLPNKEPATPILPFADAELGLQTTPDGESMTPTEEGASPAKMHTVEPSDNPPAARRRTRTIVNLMDELSDLPATAENIMTFEQMTEKADRI